MNAQPTQQWHRCLVHQSNPKILQLMEKPSGRSAGRCDAAVPRRARRLKLSASMICSTRYGRRNLQPRTPSTRRGSLRRLIGDDPSSLVTSRRAATGGIGWGDVSRGWMTPSRRRALRGLRTATSPPASTNALDVPGKSGHAQSRLHGATGAALASRLSVCDYVTGGRDKQGAQPHSPRLSAATESISVLQFLDLDET